MLRGAVNVKVAVAQMLVATFLVGISTFVHADKLPTVEASKEDPFLQCIAIAKALPRSLKELRKRGSVLSEKTSLKAQEYCDTEKYKCRLAELKMPGLEIYLLDVMSERTLSPLVVRISSAKWRLMKGIYVGQKLKELERYYGVEAPPNAGAFQICGEATCLEVRHRADLIVEIEIDCQASI